ncbi:MAG: hypothetical protein N4A49_02330 [Marinifilaceae bacterium]|jgi:hypothetical protein|nr:hypothetical protein [Marinifilaceae bacterium]
MGLLKRIFGKANPEADNKLEEEVAQIESGQINKIYPILKPGDWVGIKAGAVKQTLYGTQENPELVLAFGYDAPTNFVFLTPADIEGKDPNKIITEAYDNLETIDQEFEISSALDNRVLFASGQDFSSEKILCQKHMMKAHKLLKADELFVSIPRRRCMMITSKNEDKELLNTFIGLHKNVWNDDSYGNAPIIDALFIVKNGEIDGIIPLD